MAASPLSPASRVPRTPDPPQADSLELDHVVVTRGSRRILNGLSLQFSTFRRYVILGPSGSGKSTLVRLLNRLEDPAEGRVLLGGKDLREYPVRELRRSLIGVVRQTSRPLPGTVAQNLAYPLALAGLEPPDRTTMKQLLEDMDLQPEWLDRDASSLSGGEQQRLAIATALVCRPRLLVLDEPTSALDPASARHVAAHLKSLSRVRSMGTIAVCHQPRHAQWLGDEAVVLAAGQVVDQGHLESVLARAEEADWLPPGDLAEQPA